jgi:hypothetical protein
MRGRTCGGRRLRLEAGGISGHQGR